MSSPSSAEIFDRLHELLHLFRTRVRSRLEVLHPDLTLNEMRVLIHIGQNAGITQKGLIERSQTDKAQIARILAGLEERGLVERAPSDTDKRVRCLRLGKPGAALFTQLRDLQHEVAGQLLEHLPAGGRKQLYGLLCQAVDDDR